MQKGQNPHCKRTEQLIQISNIYQPKLSNEKDYVPNSLDFQSRMANVKVTTNVLINKR